MKRISNPLCRISIVCFCLISFVSHASEPNKIKDIITAELNRYIGDEEPGCAIAYGKDNQHYFLAKGRENTTHSTDIDENSRFITASVSKQFTAHIAMRLADKGLLDLTATIEKVLPDIPVADKINVLQLMNHTSGLPEHWELFQLQGRALTDTFTQQEAKGFLKNSRFLQFEPGSEFAYSNGGYIALTSVIEAITKTTLNDAIAQSISKPLGIKAQYFDSSVIDTSELVHGHVKNEKDEFNHLKSDVYIYGPANLIISAQEFAIWADYLNTYLSANEKKLIDILNSEPGFNYMAGLYIDRDANGTTFYHHGGYYEHATQDSIFIPSKREFIVALCNRADFRPANITRNILKNLNSLQFNTLEIDSTAPKQSIRSGFYANDKGSKSAFIFEEDDHLYYYGPLVSSPKKLIQLAESQWGFQLSTSRVFVKLVNENTIMVSNEQQRYELHQLEPQTSHRYSKGKFIYTNDLIGTVEVILGEENSVNFPSGLGSFSLRCFASAICLAEYGYLILNLKDVNAPTLSTHHLQELPLNRIQSN